MSSHTQGTSVVTLGLGLSGRMHPAPLRPWISSCVDLPLQRGHSAQGWTLPARLPTALCRPSTSRTQKHVSHEDTCVWQRRPGRCFHLLSRTEKHGWKCSIQVLRSHRVGWGGRDHCTRPSLAALQLFILTLEQRTASASRPL